MAIQRTLRKSAVCTFYVYLVLSVMFFAKVLLLYCETFSEPNTAIEVALLYTFTLMLFNSSLNLA